MMKLILLKLKGRYKKMKMIVGLGNIGKKYEGTRHNVGFMVVEHFVEEHGGNFNKEKFDSLIAELFINGEKIIVIKPTTYMNESGRAVRPLMDYFNLTTEDIIICHDDMDLEIGHLRLRQKGSAGGHNGIKSIISHVGTEKFKRVRVGIDHPQKMSVVDWVLSRFTKEQEAKLDDGLTRAVAALDDWIENDDFMNTMNRFN